MEAELVVGTYGGTLMGLRYADAPTAAGAPSGALTTSFVTEAHSGCVKALASSGGTVVSASTDESVKIFDLGRRVEVGCLLKHTGAVTCAAWHGSSHLVTGSDDKTLGIWRARDWQCLHVLKGHKGRVTAVAVHPSGKLCLSAGTDSQLCLWDLVEGRCAFKSRTEEPAASLRWAPSGQRYASAIGGVVTVTSTEARVEGSVRCAARVMDVRFVSEHVLAVASEGGLVQLWDSRGEGFTQSSSALGSRVRQLAVLGQGPGARIAAATSAGIVVVLDAATLRPLASHEFGAAHRLTSIGAVGKAKPAPAPKPKPAAGQDLPGPANKKRKKKLRKKEKQEPTFADAH